MAAGLRRLFQAEALSAAHAALTAIAAALDGKEVCALEAIGRGPGECAGSLDLPIQRPQSQEGKNLMDKLRFTFADTIAGYVTSSDGAPPLCQI